MCVAQSSDVTIETDFDMFWRDYPKKVGKDKARIAWNKKKDKPNIEIIIASVQKYITSKPVSKGFVCLPATWINEGRWHDEHEQQQGKLPDGVSIFDIIGRNGKKGIMQ